MVLIGFMAITNCVVTTVDFVEARWVNHPKGWNGCSYFKHNPRIVCRSLRARTIKSFTFSPPTIKRFTSTPLSSWGVKCENLIGLVITLSWPDQSHFNVMYTDGDSCTNWLMTAVQLPPGEVLRNRRTVHWIQWTLDRPQWPQPLDSGQYNAKT